MWKNFRQGKKYCPLFLFHLCFLWNNRICCDADTSDSKMIQTEFLRSTQFHVGMQFLSRVTLWGLSGQRNEYMEFCNIYLLYQEKFILKQQRSDWGHRDSKCFQNENFQGTRWLSYSCFAVASVMDYTPEIINLW